MVKDENFITIQGWMTKLNISGNELITYAIIYGFSQDEHSVFCGSASYIAKWLGIYKRNVLEIIQRLEEKGLIEKIEKTVNNVKICDYRIILGGGGDETSPHIYNIDNIEDSDSKKQKPVRGAFVPPTEQEVLEYAKDMNDHRGVGGFICSRQTALEFFHNYNRQDWLIGNGNHMTNWKSGLRLWAKKEERKLLEQ